MLAGRDDVGESSAERVAMPATVVFLSRPPADPRSTRWVPSRPAAACPFGKRSDGAGPSESEGSVVGLLLVLVEC